jgi:hypothetical protein
MFPFVTYEGLTFFRRGNMSKRKKSKQWTPPTKEDWLSGKVTLCRACGADMIDGSAVCRVCASHYEVLR